MSQKIKVAAALAVLTALGGCMSPAPYAPRLPGQQTGYTDRQLSDNRFRVTFAGNSVTPRTQVEDYLLLRAAQVTLAAGYGHFLFDTRDTRARTTYQAMGAPGGPYGWGWGGWWRFHPRWGYDPFAPDVDIVTTTRYTAYAEIVVLNDSEAAHEPRAVDARAVIAHLGPEAAPPPSGA